MKERFIVVMEIFSITKINCWLWPCILHASVIAYITHENEKDRHIPIS